MKRDVFCQKSAERVSFFWLFIFYNLFFQPLHDLFLQSGDIRLGNSQQIRHFLLRHLVSVCVVESEAQLHDGSLPGSQMADGRL